MSDTLTWAGLIAIVNGAQEKVKYIPTVKNSQSFTTEIVDLANNNGGYVILGFDRNNYQLVGTKLDQKWLSAAINKECSPVIHFKIDEVIRNRSKIYVIDVEEGKEKPYSVSGASSNPIQDIVTIVPPEETNILKLDNQPQKIKDQLSKRELNCLQYLEENQEITNSAYRDLNGVSHKTAHNELSHLMKLNLIEQVGQGRTTKYLLLSENLDNELIELIKQATIPTNVVSVTDDLSQKIDNDLSSKIFETSHSFLDNEKNDLLDIEEPSLFGDDLDNMFKKNTISITDIRRSEQSDHMQNHFNNDIENVDNTVNDEAIDFSSKKSIFEEEQKE